MNDICYLGLETLNLEYLTQRSIYCMLLTTCKCGTDDSKVISIEVLH